MHTAWDLGRTDDTAIWFFQLVYVEGHPQIRVVDCYAGNTKEIPEYAAMLREWAADNDAGYGTHWLPHDARPRRMGMGGKSILQQFQAEDVGRFAFVPNLDKQEGIYAARATFPLCRFDAVRCEDGIEALRHYHREWSEENQTFTNVPKHDWSSHYADSWRYLSLCWKHPRMKETGITFGAKLLRQSVQNQTYGEIMKKHMRNKKRERRESVH